MKKIVYMENSLSLNKTITEKFYSKNIEVICFSKVIDAIISIHKDPPELIILSSVLNDLRGSDALEYLKNNKDLKQIPIIMYSTVTNAMNNIYFEKSNVFIKRDTNFLTNIIKTGTQLLEEQNSEHPISKIVSENEIFSEIDKIYYKRDILNQIILDLLEQSFSLLSLEDTIENCLNILGSYFSIKSITYQIKNNNYIKEFEIPKSINLEQHEILLKGIENTQLEIVHFIDNNDELDNLNFTMDIVTKALGYNVSYKENLEMSKRLNYLFKNFLPEKVVDDLLNKESQKSLMTGEKREVAVIFSHIKKFNIIEEKLSAKEVVDFLNNHFSGLSKNIKKYGGEINKFIGDALFAMIGAPSSFNDNEERAINAALDMTDFVQGQQEEYNIGIGIHVGKAIIGNIGSEDNFDYTAIGDTINLAARLESLCKYYNVNILISDTVHKACMSGSSNTRFREIDTVMVQGKDEPTTIYSVEDLSIYPEDYIHTYNKGLKMFKLGNWNFANNYFKWCEQLLPKNKVVDIYLERCSKFLETPPLDWNGAITLGFK